MAFRKTFSNVSSVIYNAAALTGVEEITLTEDASRVSAGADDALHEDTQFIGMRSTQVTLTLQEPPPFTLPAVNTGIGATLSFTVMGRMGAANRVYSIANVIFFNLSTNGAYGAMRKWTLTGNAVIETTGTPTPVTVVTS